MHRVGYRKKFLEKNLKKKLTQTCLEIFLNVVDQYCMKKWCIFFWYKLPSFLSVSYTLCKNHPEFEILTLGVKPLVMTWNLCSRNLAHFFEKFSKKTNGVHSFLHPPKKGISILRHKNCVQIILMIGHSCKRCKNDWHGKSVGSSFGEGEATIPQLLSRSQRGRVYKNNLC